MAHGFVCVQSGWQESTHIHGGFALSDAERAEMSILKPGRSLTHLQCAQSYEPSAEELEYIKAKEAEGGPHEGQH
jgi:hypothetical protein